MKKLEKIINHPLTKKGIKLKFYETLITGLAIGIYSFHSPINKLNSQYIIQNSVNLIRDNSQEELNNYLVNLNPQNYK